MAYSPQELRNLAWNCRSLARETQPRQVQESLIRMAEDFERKASQAERHFEPIGGGRY